MSDKKKSSEIKFDITDGKLGFCYGDGQKIVVPNNVKVIENVAFSLCKDVRELVIPASVETIEQGAFPEKIESITVAADNPVYESVGNTVIEKRTRKLVFAGRGSVPPSGIKIIGECALDNRKDLSELVIPDGTEELESAICAGAINIRRVVIPASVKKIAQGAFVNTDGIREFVSHSPYYFVDGGCLIERDDGTLIRACSGCVIPDSVKNLGKHCFGNEITELHFGAEVVSGMSGAFCQAMALGKLTVSPDNKVYRSENNCVIERESGMLVRGCRSSVVPKGVTEIGPYAFENSLALFRITLPDGVKRIHDYAFCSCVNLEEIVFPETLERIGRHAFMICDKIKQFDLPKSLRIIDPLAFGYCGGLRRVVIPAGVVRIGETPFFGCDALEELDFEDEVGWVCEGVEVGAEELHGEAAIKLLEEDSVMIKVGDETA